MASKNLEQGIQAIQQKDMEQGKRLLKIALKNDPLNLQERVQAFTWLAETDPNPQYKVEQYQQALQLDPTNQDIRNRLTYWSQQAQQALQGGTFSQGAPLVNPQQQQFNQQYTPTQGMPPIQANQQASQQQQFNQLFPSQQDLNIRPDWQQNSPSQGMPPVQPNIQGNWNTPSQGMPPVQPNIQGNWNTPSQGMPPVQPNIQGNWNTPSQGMIPIQPQQQNFNQGYTPQPMPQTPAVQGQVFNTQASGVFGQEAPIQLQQVQRTVGIKGGPSGVGTGFFVTRDGLIATTRHVVGGERKVNVQLLDGRQVIAEVVRAFPNFDLALLRVNVQVAQLLGVSQAPMIPDDMPIVAVTHSGEGIRSAKRRSINEIEHFWFPTIINHLKDAGGNPIFDANNMLVGMLTSNASRSNGYMYGLHIHKVYECVDKYIHEKGQLDGQNTIYCNSCGIISRAPSFSGYFCESCGNTHPYAINIQRHPQPNLAALYGEDSQRPCPNCASQVGFYDRACLRCGYRL